MYSQGGQLLFSNSQQNAVTTSTRYIYLGGKLIAEDGTAGVVYNHTDALGSPVARTDASAQVQTTTSYEPYGKTAAGTNPAMVGFTGHVNDGDTGLVQMQQRYYDPVAARFMSEDPVMTDANTGKSFNRYVYANNNPYKYTDPDGRFANFVWGAAVGFVIEAGSQVINSGKVDNWTAVGVATGVGALTGGLSGFAVSAATKGVITAGEAVKASSAAAGLSSAVGKNAEAALTGQAVTPKEVAISAGGAALGGAAGAKLGTSLIGSAEKLAASASNVFSGMGNNTLGAITQGGASTSVTVGASATTQKAADVLSGAAGKKLEDATK